MRTPEQVLREIVAQQIFTVAQQISEIESLKEEVQKLTEENKKLNQILSGNSPEER